MGIASLVLGIIAIVFDIIDFIVPVFGVICLILSIVGLVLGIVGTAKKKRCAVGGLVCSIIALALCTGWIACIGCALWGLA